MRIYLTSYVIRVLYLLGTEIDWVTDIMGDRFVFDNPLAKASCGWEVVLHPNNIYFRFGGIPKRGSQRVRKVSSSI